MIIVYRNDKWRYGALMPDAGADEIPQDFSFDEGRIGCSDRGRQLLLAFHELIKGTLPAVAAAFDENEAEPGSRLSLGQDAAVSAYVQFCIACLYEPARAHYGAHQGSLFADALFADCHNGRLPRDDLFQMYLEYPIFPDNRKKQLPDRPGRLPGSRIFQFICDVLGRPDIRPMILLSPTAGQLMVDGKAVFEAADPEQMAKHLVECLFTRLMERLNVSTK